MAQNMEHAQVNCTKVILVWGKKRQLFFEFFFFEIQRCEISNFPIDIGQKKQVIIGFQHWLKKIHIVHP